MAKRSKGRLTKEEHAKYYQKSQISSLYFNRYLMIRYFLAVFFFANFFWAYMAWGHWSEIIPATLFIISIVPTFQLGFMWGKGEDVKTKATEWFFRIQCAVCILMMILAWTAPMEQIYPGFANDDTARLVLFGMFLIGFIMCVLVLLRFEKIHKNMDKQYGRIKFFESKYNVKAGKR